MQGLQEKSSQTAADAGVSSKQFALQISKLFPGLSGPGGCVLNIQESGGCGVNEDVNYSWVYPNSF